VARAYLVPAVIWNGWDAPGGWITSKVVGSFKVAPGTHGW